MPSVGYRPQHLHTDMSISCSTAGCMARMAMCAASAMALPMSRESKKWTSFTLSRIGRWRLAHRRADTGSRGGSSLALRAQHQLLTGTSTDQTGSSWEEESYCHYHHCQHHLETQSRPSKTHLRPHSPCHKRVWGDHKGGSHVCNALGRS